jgi:Fe2+ or Zn2+ uptake regulation protein
MRTKDFNDFLEIVRSHITTREMQVLKAVFDAKSSEENLPSFDDIYLVVRKSGEKLTKAWIYKCLAKLEEDGFLVVDSIRNPRRYMVTRETLIAGIENTRKKRIMDLEQEIEEVDQQLHFLSETDVSKLTSHVIDIMTGEKMVKTSGAIEGAENIRTVIITQMREISGPGNVLKIINRLDALEGGPLSVGPVENKLLESVIKGLKLQALIIPTGANKQGSELLARFLSGVSKLFIDAINSGRLQMRFLQEGTETYRMLCLNQDMLILYLTDTYKADTAALVYRKDNPILVDDAVSTFDRLWDKAIDATEFLKQLVSAKEME